jgi:hypothetical protein
MHQQSARPAPSVATFPRSAEVAAIVQVSFMTISRWTRAGRFPCQRTLRGHRHSSAATIHLLAALGVPEVGA